MFFNEPNNYSIGIMSGDQGDVYFNIIPALAIISSSFFEKWLGVLSMMMTEFGCANPL